MNRQLWHGLSKALASNSNAMQQEGRFPGEAAVLALVTDSVAPELIYTLRAKHLNQHAGEVCFPGGKWEQQDANLLVTALRETHEEIGVASSMIEVFGALPARTTRSGALVRPFVGKVSSDCRFQLNHHELDELFTVPLAAFQRGLQTRTDVFEHNGQKIRLPAYHYKGYEIWGFTAGVTSELLTLWRAVSEFAE